MKKEFKIFPFSQYVVRTPLFPLSFYLELSENYSREKVINSYKKPLIKEALNLTSSELTNELNKWANADCFNETTTTLELTLLKYIARMCSRCTPFGLFAGCSVGKIDHQTNIVLELPEKHKRFTQFDMHFWVALLQNIATQKRQFFILNIIPIHLFTNLAAFIDMSNINT